VSTPLTRRGLFTDSTARFGYWLPWRSYIGHHSSYGAATAFPIARPPKLESRKLHISAPPLATNPLHPSTIALAAKPWHSGSRALARSLQKYKSQPLGLGLHNFDSISSIANQTPLSAQFRDFISPAESCDYARLLRFAILTCKNCPVTKVCRMVLSTAPHQLLSPTPGASRRHPRRKACGHRPKPSLLHQHRATRSERHCPHAPSPA
jgi:hypothetical protein